MGDANRRLKGMRTIFAGAIVLVALYIGIGYSAVQAPETASAIGSTRAGSGTTTVDATVPDRGPILVSVVVPPELALRDGEDAVDRAGARGPYGFHPPAETARAASAVSIAARRSAPAAEERAVAARMAIPADSQAEAAVDSAEGQSPAGAYYLLVTPGASADAVASPAVAAKSTGAPSGHLSDSETAPSGAGASSVSSGRSASAGTGSGQSPDSNQSGGGQIAGGSAASSGGASIGSGSGGGQIAGGGSAAGSSGTGTSSGSDSESGSGGDSSAGGAGQSSGSAGGVVGAAGNAVGGAVDSAGKAAAGAVGGVSHAAGGLAGAVGGKLGK